MSSIRDALSGQGTPLQATLDAGIDSLSLDQEITFTKYVKLILPMDGFVFWVRADLVSPSALFNASEMNAFALNQQPEIITPSAELIVKGSLHYSTEMQQNQDETIAINRVIFTSEDAVADFNQIGPNSIFIATFDGIRFAFSNRGSFYRQADIYHYTGAAIYSDMDTQIVDSIDDLDTRNVVVSNSLPIWLGLNGYVPPYPNGFGNTFLPLYPSFLLPPNLQPPFASVHIIPETTIGIGTAPIFDKNLSQTQLVQETVEVTMYGMRNFDAQDFMACVLQYTLDNPTIMGIMNIPVLRDDKRTQVELVALSQKKTVTFQVNYYQSRMRDVARQLILNAIPDFIIA